MTSMRYAFLNLIRNWKRHLLIVLVLTFVLVSELICSCLAASASRGEKEAFRYHGAAFTIDIDSNHTLTQELRENILNISHVRGLSCSAIWEMEAEQLYRTQAHTGYTVEQDAKNKQNARRFTLFSDIDVSMSKWFWSEPCVSLEKGEFPTVDNRGLLLESHVAKENGVGCGDEITFSLEGNRQFFTLPVCGIYKVDSDFAVATPSEYNYSGEDSSFDVYDYSPYNRIYADYDVIADLVGEPVGKDRSLHVFVDAYENIDTVARQLKSIAGQEYALYDRGSKYLEDFGMLTLVSGMTRLISQVVTIVGVILILIIMTYYAMGFKFECGLMMLMGQPRRKVICRYLLLAGMLVLGALGLAFLLYLLIGPEVVERIVVAANSFANGKDESLNFYRVSLYQPFTMTANIAEILNGSAVTTTLGATAVLLAGTALIPVRCVFHTRPRQLLE